MAGLATLAACSGDAGGDPSLGGADTTAGGGAGATGPQSLVALADVPVGGAVSATMPDGAEIIISRPTEGEVLAFSAICTHQGCVVAPADTLLRCPCHGSEFDLATGEVVNGPAEDPLPSVAVEVQGTEIVTG